MKFEARGADGMPPTPDEAAAIEAALEALLAGADSDGVRVLQSAWRRAARSFESDDAPRGGWRARR